MIRRINRYKNTQRVYYICSTKNRGEGCTRHSIPEDALKQLVLEMVTKFANCFLQEKQMFEKSLDMETNFESIVHYDTEIARLKEEQDKYYSLCSGLYEDLKEGIITKSEFERLHSEFKRKAGEFEEAQKKQELMIKELLKNGHAVDFDGSGFRLDNGSNVPVSRKLIKNARQTFMEFLFQRRS